MKFQSEKKELWRYASKNLTAPARGTNRQQPPPHRHQHQRLPQSRDCVMMRSPQHGSLLGYCDGYGENSTSSTSVMNMSLQENISTPPPPYSSVPELDYFSNTTMPDYCLTFRQHRTYPTDGETESSVSATDSDTCCGRKQAPNRDGCKYGNTGDITLVDDNGKLNETSTSSSCQLSIDLQKKTRRLSPQQDITSRPQVVASTTSSTTSFTATAVKIFRNCCGGTFGSSNSIITTPSNATTNRYNTTNNTCNKLSYEYSKNGVDHIVSNSNNYLPEQYFSTLMKQLKASQISSLLKAVKSRHDQIIPTMPAISSTSSQRCCVTNYQANCILIRRAEILGEEPYVIACRLFFWRDLKNVSQLKRLPACPNERDPVYVCCNPLHWYRILETAHNKPET